ncbi:MAG: hypothetical protein JO223_23890, partial [Hyphomicrobiales bacterium]|nr:hypothetical protein [Hyphomicrobiales bacterium]
MSVWSIAFSPFLPPWAIIALSAVALAITVVLVWRRVRGAWLRALAFALLILGLCDPNLVQENRRPLKDIVALVVDRSASQDIGERPGQTDEARDELKARLNALGDVDLRVVETSRQESDTEGTKLFSALRGALSDAAPERVGGAIMITDGVVHDIPGSVAALGFDAPLHALITGSPDEKDNRIEVVSAPRFGLVGSEQVAEVKAERSGKAADGALATILIRRASGVVETVQAPYGAPVSIRMRFDHAGPNIVEVELKPEPGELTTINNKTVIQAQGVRENLRVLLVSGEPHAGERTWRNLLRSDAAVDLVHFTILRPPEKHDGT